jgi:thiamine phosphate synthase YjbQ (UPF0047 family)
MFERVCEIQLSSYVLLDSMSLIDMDMALDKIVPEDLAWLHTDEGPEYVENWPSLACSDHDCSMQRLVSREIPPSDTNANFTGDHPRVSHTKTSLVGASLQIPITNHQLNLGTWQGALITAWLYLIRFLMALLPGIYLTEFRHMPHTRRLVATIL